MTKQRLFAALAMFAAIVVVAGVAVAVDRHLAVSPSDAATVAAPVMAYPETEHDFGTVKQSGGPVTYRFAYTYNGDVDRTVVNVLGSCACTTGSIDRTVLHPGDTGYITARFDPNMHAEPEGKFSKTVTLVTDPPLPSDMQDLRFWVQVDVDLGPDAYELKGGDPDGDEDAEATQADAQQEASGEGYQNMEADTLRSWLADAGYMKDFTLIDVHIPEQQHIAGTDLVIPFNEIAIQKDKLPADKDAKIVVYCRSGNMSVQAAEALVALGYTNVYNLEGGENAYNASAPSLGN